MEEEEGMGDIQKGSCLCGAVSFEIEGALQSFFLCHCSRCRKDSGSAHAANIFSTSAKLRWLSGEEKVRTFVLPSTRHARSFCCVCGSALPGQQMQSALLAIPAGSLDSDFSMRPDAHICVADKAAWDEDLHTIRVLEGLPGQ